MLDSKDIKLAESIGIAANRARLALGLTLQEAASRIGLSADVYDRLERGKVIPSVLTLARLALTFGVSVDELVAGCELTPAE